MIPGLCCTLALVQLAGAASADTIRFRAGVHAGPLVIEQPTVLIGEPGAVLDGGTRGTVITVRSDSVVIHGLTIRGGGRSLDHDDAAVKLERCTGCRVIGNTIERPLHGIYLLESHGVTVARNVITGSADLVESSR